MHKLEIFYPYLKMHKRILGIIAFTLSHTCRYIKEGSIMSVMGVVQKNDSVLMIVHTSEPLSSGCQWPSKRK